MKGNHEIHIWMFKLHNELLFFKEYDKENASISDEKKKMFIKILRKEENQRELDTRSQPGCDLNSYLRDLKFRAR